MNVRNALGLGRLAVWLAAFLLVLLWLARTRLEVSDLRERIDRGRHELEVAETLNGRLTAEFEHRRRAAVMMTAADRLGLVAPSEVVHVTVEE